MTGWLEIDLRVSHGAFTLDVARSLPLDGVTALFGQSGSGKTTLLRAVAGLEDAAEGAIRFRGESWLGPDGFLPAHRRGVGVVFQDARLFDHLDVEGNLRYAARRAGGREGPAFDQVTAALDLAPLLRRRTGALSGGERQRVAMGRALLSCPRLLLLDEPLAALDMRRRAAILPYIERVVHDFGIPAIYVTHSVDEVAQLADRLVVLSGGRIAAAGELPDALEEIGMQAYTGRFEAGALLDVRVAGHDREDMLTEVMLGDRRMVMPLLDLPVGAEIRLRARARDVSVATERPKGLSIRNILPGRIAAVVVEEDTAFAEAVIDVGDSQLRARLTRSSVRELGLEPGREVFALIKSVAFDRRVLPRTTRIE